MKLYLLVCVTIPYNKTIKIMQDLFSSPISKTKVRNGIYAYKYANGCININGTKYFDYSIKDAIKMWRSNN
jgi:hypothetical protein